MEPKVLRPRLPISLGLQQFAVDGDLSSCNQLEAHRLTVLMQRLDNDLLDLLYNSLWLGQIGFAILNDQLPTPCLASVMEACRHGLGGP